MIKKNRNQFWNYLMRCSESLQILKIQILEYSSPRWWHYQAQPWGGAVVWMCLFQTLSVKFLSSLRGSCKWLGHERTAFIKVCRAISLIPVFCHMNRVQLFVPPCKGTTTRWYFQWSILIPNFELVNVLISDFFSSHNWEKDIYVHC